MGPPLSTWPYSPPGGPVSDRVPSDKCLVVKMVDGLRAMGLNVTLVILFVHVLFSLSSVTAGPVILNLDYSQGPVPLARNIRHLPCISRRTGQEGLCMFAIDCLKANGSHLGTCIDRFYFGSCCQIPDKTILPQIIGNNIEDNSIDSANFVHPQTEDKVQSTVSKIPDIFPTRTTTIKPETTVADKSETVQDRTEPVDLETKSDESTTVDDKLDSKLTTLEATTKIPPSKAPVTEIPIKLSTFQSVSNDVGSLVTEKIETPEKDKPTEVVSSTTRKPTRKPIKPTYKPRPTYRPSNFTRPTYLPSTIKPRPTKPPLVFNITRKPVYKPPPRRPSTKKPLPSPPRLNITIIPQSTSTRPAFTRPITTSITYINTTVASEERTTTTTSTTTPSTTTTEKLTTAAPTTVLTTERITETAETVTETIVSSSTEEMTEKVTERTTSTTEAALSEASSSESPETPAPEAPETPASEATLPSSESSSAVSESSSPSSELTLPSSESSIPSSEAPEEPTPLEDPLQEPSSETVPTETVNETTTPVMEKETTRPATEADIPSSSPTTVVSTEFPPLVTWSTVDIGTKAPENITTTTVTDDKWSPITPPEGWVLISTIPPTPEPSSTSTTTTTTTTEAPTVETTETTVEVTTEKAASTESSTSSTTTTTVTTTTTEASSEAPSSPMHEFSVNVTLSPTVPTTTESVTLAVNLTTTTDSSTSTSSTIEPAVDISQLNTSSYKDVCGRRLWPQARIVGGHKSAFGHWPWQISLRQYRTSTYLHKCGAALLNENWAITAAHCVDHVPPSELLVRLGEHDLANDDEPFGYAERRVQIIASHPHFDPATFEYDLALLRFYEPVTFQPNILPVCVPDNDDDFVGKTAFVTGWGRLYDDGPLPSVLQEVRVPVINNSLCESMYQDAGYNEHIPNIFICAGRRSGGADSCEGDSGGPMVVQRDRDNRFVLGGVISWGIGCAEPNQPGVYTRISEFRDWINQILQF